MKKYQKKSKKHLNFAGDGNTVKVLGLITHDRKRQSLSVIGGDFPYFCNSDALYLFADLRERSCVIMTGTTYDVLSTPDQARFFCARDKAQEKAINSNDQIVRRSRQCAHALYPRPAARSFYRSQCAHALYPRPAARSFYRSATPQRIFTANHARFTAGAAGNAIPSPALTSADAFSTAEAIWTGSSKTELRQGR